MKDTALLAENLRVIRARRNLNISEASQLIGITRETLRDLELGARNPYYPTLKKIADAYSVPVEELLAPSEDLAGLRTGKAEASEAGPEEPGPRELYESHLKTTLIGHADTLIARGEDVVNDLKTSKGDLPLVQVADFGYATWALRGVLDKQVPAVKQDPDVRETMEELEAVERQVNPLLTPWFGPNPLKPAEWETRGLFVDRLAENQAEANAEPEERAAEPGA